MDNVKPALDDVRENGKGALKIVRENPLGLVLGALALGFIVGLIVPVSDLENEKLGPIRDNLLDQAQAVANDAIQQSRAVLAETAAAAMQAATTHGESVIADAKETFSGKVAS